MKPNKKRPIELTVLIMMLLIGVINSIHGLLSTQAPYIYLNIIVIVLMSGLAWGLWFKKDKFREIMVTFSFIITLCLLLGLMIEALFLYQGKSTLALSEIPGLLSLLSIAILVVYLRSKRATQYFLNQEQEQNNS